MSKHPRIPMGNYLPPIPEGGEDGMVLVYDSSSPSKTRWAHIPSGPPGKDAPPITIDPDSSQWVIGGIKTGAVAVGKDGETPAIDPKTGKWVIAGALTTERARAMDGRPGTVVTINPATQQWELDGVPTGIIARGEDGAVPEIDTDTGEWKIKGVSTGVVARGRDGKTPQLAILPNGNMSINGVDTGRRIVGTDGTPGTIVTISADTQQWELDGVSTGIKAVGKDGDIPEIDPETKQWRISGKLTGVKAEGLNGRDADKPLDGHSPVVKINSRGNLEIDGQDTGVKVSGSDGFSPYINDEFYWVDKNGNTGVKASGQPGRDSHAMCKQCKVCKNFIS